MVATNKVSTDADDKANARRLSPIRNVIAGSVGGMVGFAAGQPLDTLKVRLQAMAQPTRPGQAPPFTGPLDCLMKTIKLEGVRGLYRGMLSPLLMATPTTAVTFYTLSLGKRLQLDNPNQEPTLQQYFKAGLFCGFCAAFLFGPMERVKCLLQIQQSAGAGAAKYKGPSDVVRSIYRKEGFRGIFRGIGVTLVRDSLGNGAWYLTYEGLLKMMRSSESSRDDVGTLQIMGAGGTAGVVLWGFIYPLDMLKTRVQISPAGTYPRGARDALKEVLQSEGPKALYRGCTPTLLRAMVVHVSLFTGYEYTMKLMNYLAP